MECYVKTICTKTFFVQQHYLVTVMLSSMTHLKKKKRLRDALK